MNLKLLIERLANAGRSIAEKLKACRFCAKIRALISTFRAFRAKHPKQKKKPLSLIQRIARAFVLFCAAAFVFSAIINIYMILSTKKYVYTQKELVPSKTAAIVLGAKVYNGGYVSIAFRDRIVSGAELLSMGKAEKILISGDHGRKTYDEVNTGRNFILKNYPEIAHEDIFMDHAGFSTYETMYRAKAVFCVDDAVIVTQAFHLPRALYIAHKLGIDAVGYEADESVGFRKRVRMSWALREYLARVKAFMSVAFHVKPTYLGEQIPITGDGTKSWD